jgi:chemotaxis family two-component system response regulator Rcp1
MLELYWLIVPRPAQRVTPDSKGTFKCRLTNAVIDPFALRFSSGELVAGRLLHDKSGWLGKCRCAMEVKARWVRNAFGVCENAKTMALEELVTAPRSLLNTLAPTEGGTEYASDGIGLSIRKKIIECQALGQSPGSTRMRTLEILLVDDNPADTDLTSEVLASHSCPSHIHPVLDGVEAIAFLRQKGKYGHVLVPDFVILDLNLPKKSGRDVLAEVKADPVLCKIPIAIFSTSEAWQDVVRSYELGANCYVRKPGNLRDFVAAVTAIGQFWFSVARLPYEEQG